MKISFNYWTPLFLFAILLGNTVSQGASVSDLKDLKQKISRLTAVEISAETKHLSSGDKKALEKMVAAAKLLDPIYLRQVWPGNIELKQRLEKDKSETGKLLFHLFMQNKGPWSRLDKNEPFIDGVPHEKPAKGGVYPEDLTKNEFESWVKSLKGMEKERATGFFHVIRRDAKGKLISIPYSVEYKEFLEPAAKLLKQAAALTTNASLKTYLDLRADAFLNDDYYASDVAWMDLDAPIELTIGPYETYEDEFMGYKAAFEAYVTLRDDMETAKLAKFSGYLQEIEDNLPIEKKYKNPKLGAMSPIRVVDEVFSSGEARRGVSTAAFNLPNDEKVVKEKGSKRVMLKNIQEKKFEKVLTPIAEKLVLNRKDVQFEPFFTHILMHELMHGLGPHQIKVGKQETSVRKELKDTYSAIEEAKADITGLFAMQYLMDKKVIDSKMQETMYTTFLASTFRSVRFGITEAHGKGIALQFNFLEDEGAFLVDKNGKFFVDVEKCKLAVKKLTGILLTIEAEGSYSKAKDILTKYAVIRPKMQAALDKLHFIPIDIEPFFPIAE